MSQPIPLPDREEDERRRYPRRGIRDMPLVRPIPGEVVNLSAGGIGIATWDALSVNQELTLSFGPSGQRVQVRARVIWCRFRSAPKGVDWLPGYLAGLKFLEFPK